MEAVRQQEWCDVDRRLMTSAPTFAYQILPIQLLLIQSSAQEQRTEQEWRTERCHRIDGEEVVDEHHHWRATKLTATVFESSLIA